MSKSYDDRIVRMGFDNSKFESNAAKTMTTLDKLNEKLKLKGATEGGNNIQRSIDNVNFAAMERAIVNIERRFSTLGVVGMNVIGQITNGIVGSVKQLEAATIGQIKSGGWSRAMNIANAKFQIEGLGFAWEEVEKAVSYGVKDTAYGLDAAASAASQLAASGVDFKKTLDTVNGQDLTAMHKSLRAISGVAAMTNSSYEDIARIFTTVAGNGRLMGDQLLQLSSRGMNAAAKLAEVLNTTEEEVRDMVSRGKIDFQTFAFAMDDAFGAHAKEANKTFTGALGNMKAALSRVGEIFASPIINKTNTLFISLTERIDEFKNKLKSIKVPRTLDEIRKQYDGITMSATAYDQMLKGMEGRTVTFGDHFSEMWQSGIDAFSAMIKSVDIGWFDKIVEKVDSVTVKIKEFFDLIKEIYGESAEEAADTINDATQTLLVSAEEAQAAKDIILKGMYGSGQKRVDVLTEMFGGGDKGAKHAKNVQAYIDSVISAGWDFEKASIKVDKASKSAAKSQGKVARDVRKAKFKAILDNITGALSDLWTAAKNIGRAIAKVAKPIINAFASVFNINISSVSSKTKSLTKLIADASSKLIVSDKTASKIQNVFTKIFTIVKNVFDKIKGVFNFISPYISAGIEKIKTFISSVQDSKLFTTIKNLFTTIYDALTGEDTKTLKDSPLLSSIKEVIDSMRGITDGNEETPRTFTDFINNVIDGIMGIKWGEVAKMGIATGAVIGIADFMDSIKSLSGVIASIGKIPKSISEFFENMGDAVESAGNVLEITSIAGSLAIVALSLVILSQIPDDQLYKAVGVMIVIAIVIKAMAKTSKTISESEKTIKGAMGALSSAFGLAKTIYSVAIALLAFSGSIALLSIALGIIEKSNAANGEAFLALAGMMGVLTIMMNAIIGELQKIDQKTLMKLPAVMFAMSALFVAFGLAILSISGALSIISTIPSDAFGLVIVLFAAMIGGMAVILNLATDVKAGRALAAAATISAIGAGMSAIIMSIAGASIIISAAVSMLETNKVKPETYLLVLSGIGSLFLATLFLANMANGVDDFVKVSITLLAMSAAMISMGTAVAIIAAGLSLITHIGGDDVGNALLILGSILSSLVILMYMTNAVDPKKMLASAVMFTGIAFAISVLTGAIAMLSLFGSEKTIEAAMAVAIALVGLGAAMMLAGTSLSVFGNTPKLVIGGVLAMAVVIAVIGSTLSKIGDTKNIIKSALALGIVFAALSIAMLAFAAFGSKKDMSGTPFIEIGAAFIMVSAALLILSFAIEKMASVLNGPGVVGALVVMGGFIAMVGALGLIAAAIGPMASLAFEAIGKAFLYAGAGAALVGAGIILVAAGIKILAPAVGLLAVGLDALFITLENHIGAAIAVGIIVIAIIAGSVIAIVQLEKTIKAIAYTISSVFHKTGVTLDKGTSKFSDWVNNLSTKGKATIAAMIVALCGAIMKASPEILSTVGKLIIKLLAFLGSIAGDVAMGLLEFVINLINGLADAIRANSASIAAAIWNVVMSLIDVVWQILGQLVYMLIAPFSERIANKVMDFVQSGSDGLNMAVMEQRQLALEADKAKKDYIESIQEASGATEDAADRSSSALGGLFDMVKSGSKEQKSELQSLKEEYSDLPGYAYDAILRSKQAQSKAASTGDNPLDMVNPEEMMKQFGGDAEYDGSGLINPDIAYDSGTTYTTTEAEGIIDGKDEIYDASAETTGSAQQAIVDSKEDTKKVVQENFNDPFQLQIRSGKANAGKSVEYVVEGMISAMDDKKDEYAAAAVRLAKAGNRAFEEENKINSPSKLYYQNGAYIVQGLVNGIEQNTQNVESAVGDMSNAILVSFGNPIDYLSKITTGELVYDPSIRPVFDGSSIRAGASSINSMLQSQTISVSGFSGRLAADISSLDQTNSDVVNEIRALREDLSYMEEAISEMQVVMDTGALVGQMAGPMDNALGQRAIRSGRGN